MERRFGLPYQGSKNKIAEWVVSVLPAGRRLVDLFCGGCSVTHAALESGKWGRFLANDIDGDVPRLFLDAVRGKFRNERRWISREDFFRLKDSDVYVSLVWSFGNNRRTYLYSKEVEPWKKALHYARVLGDFSLLREFGISGDGSRADVVAHAAEYKEKYIRWYLANVLMSVEDYEVLVRGLKEKNANESEKLRQYLLSALKAGGLTQAEVNQRLGNQMSGHYFGRSQWSFPTREEYVKMQAFMPLPKSYDEIYGLSELYDSLQRLQSLESLQRLQSLERLERLQRLQSLQVSARDYRDVAITEGDVVYCDIPYKGTGGYLCDFNHSDFYQWAQSCEFPVFVSEYDMPEGWAAIGVKSKARLFNGKGSDGKAQEKIFVQERYSAQFYNNLFGCLM